MTAEDNLEKLKKHLTTSSVPDSCITHMTKPEDDGGMGMASISDFASIFTKADYEEGCKTQIVDKTDKAGSGMALSRVRSAWVLARSEFDKTAAAVKSGSANLEYDLPVDEPEEKTRKGEFDGAYSNLSFNEDSTPAATIVGRFYREFRSEPRQMTMAHLTRMRSDTETRPMPPAKRSRLGEEVEMIWNAFLELPDKKIHTVLDV